MAKFEFTHPHGVVLCPICSEGCFITVKDHDGGIDIDDTLGCEHLTGVQLLHKPGSYAVMYVFE